MDSGSPFTLTLAGAVSYCALLSIVPLRMLMVI